MQSDSTGLKHKNCGLIYKVCRDPNQIIFSTEKGAVKSLNRTTLWVGRKVYWGSNFQGHLLGREMGGVKSKIEKKHKDFI